MSLLLRVPGQGLMIEIETGSLLGLEMRSFLWILYELNGILARDLKNC
jgi:hypothetical protein